MSMTIAESRTLADEANVTWTAEKICRRMRELRGETEFPRAQNGYVEFWGGDRRYPLGQGTERRIEAYLSRKGRTLDLESALHDADAPQVPWELMRII